MQQNIVGPMQFLVKSAVAKLLVIYDMRSGMCIWLCIVHCYNNACSLCALMHVHFMLHMVIQVCTLRRDEQLFTYRQQICVCVHVYVCVCAANICLNWHKAKTVCLCKVCIPVHVCKKLVCFQIAEPVLDVSHNGELWFIRPCLVVALCVGFPCDAKSEIGGGLLSAGLQGESSACNPVRYKLLVWCCFILQVGSHPRGNFNLRESVLNKSSPEHCHVRSIDPFCSFLKQNDREALHRWGEVKEGNWVYLRTIAMASPALGWLQPCAESQANDPLPGNMTKERGFGNAALRHSVPTE